MKIAVLFLCHEAPSHVARRLASPFFQSEDVKVYIHYDAKRSNAELAKLRELLPKEVQTASLDARVRCGWGEYTLVEATHRLMKLALEDASFEADYLLLLSGSCIPIRPLKSLQTYLERQWGMDFIQAVDISQRRWVKDGLERERYQYYFPFNFITQRKLFERSTSLQMRFKIQRKMPEELRIHFGSQWFCLTRDTAAKVSKRLSDPKLRDFFAISWIPDEFAIQTLVAAEQSGAFIAGHNLTYYEFDPQGRPLVLDNGHYEHLMRQPFFFARKIAPEATLLIDQIEDHQRKPELDLSYFANVGQATPDFRRFIANALANPTKRSRVGTVEDPWRGVMDYSQRRYYVLYAASPSFLRAVIGAARKESGLPVFEYLFDPSSMVPAAGVGSWYGIQAGMRARRDYDPGAFLHELVHVDPENAVAFALDPAIECWTRAFVQWDRNAILVNCDPWGLDKVQLAEAALRHMDASAGTTDLAVKTSQAAFGTTWLPQAHYLQVQAEGQASCTFVDLHAVPEHVDDPTLRALRKAFYSTQAAPYYSESAEARSRLVGARPVSFAR